MTISELKGVLAQYPDTHPDGTPCEVWLQDGAGFSSEVTSVQPLNVREVRGSGRTSDILLS